MIGTKGARTVRYSLWVNWLVPLLEADGWIRVAVDYETYMSKGDLSFQYREYTRSAPVRVWPVEGVPE